MSMNKTLLLIRGVQGSGKSTLAGMIKEGPNGPFHHLEADMYYTDPETNEYLWDPTKLGAAHLWCQHRTEAFMKVGDNIIVSNTFVKKKEMKPYLELADKYGYTVQEIICKGRFTNLHGVPEEKVEEKRKAFEYV